MSNRVTMKDVAAASGVSQATVSFVLNATPGQTISTETRRRVVEAARSLGYVTPQVAYALREPAARHLLLVATGMPWAEWLRLVILGVTEEAEEHGCAVHVTYGDPSLSVAGSGGAAAPRGVIDLPQLLQGDNDSGWVHGMVASCEVQMHHLADLGHRRVLVAVPDTSGGLIDRFVRNASLAAEAAGIAVQDVQRFSVDADARADSQPRLVTGASAIACFDDVTALAVLAAAEHQGLRVPEDVAVIGFTDSPEGRLASPALSTVRLDTHAYGRVLARQALGMGFGDVQPAPPQAVRRATT